MQYKHCRLGSLHTSHIHTHMNQTIIIANIVDSIFNLMFSFFLQSCTPHIYIHICTYMYMTYTPCIHTWHHKNSGGIWEYMPCMTEKESKISRPVGNLICKSYANQGLALCNSASGQRDFHGITLDSTAKYIIILY